MFKMKSFKARHIHFVRSNLHVNFAARSYVREDIVIFRVKNTDVFFPRAIVAIKL